VRGKPHILVAANGIDRSEAAIFAGLHRQGMRLSVIHDPIIPPASLATLQEAGIECTALEVRSRIQASARRLIRKTVRLEECDLVYAPLNRTLSAALAATRRRPVPVVGYRGTVGHLSRWDPACWLTYFHRRLSHIVAVSDAVADYLTGQAGIDPTRVTRIYKGHDPDWYADLQPEQPLPAAPAGTLTVAFAGRIRPVKGVPWLLKALQLIPADEPVRVFLIGEIADASVQRLLDDPQLAGRVVALGQRADAAALIGSCDVLAVPSVAREGLPRAAIEAMSQRIPVVATSVGGLPELVEDGRTGLLVPRCDSAAIAGALRRLRADPALRRSMGEAGCKRVAERFHIRDTINQYAELFQRLIAGGTSRSKCLF